MPATTDDEDEDRVIRDSAYLAAQARLPNGDRMIDRVVTYAGMVRAAKKAKWTPAMIAPLEDDLIRVLTAFYRRAKWYRSPT